MDRDTFDSTMLALKRRTPFSPFTVTMMNGDRLEFDYPEALAIRDGVALFLARGHVPVIFAHEGVNSVIGDLAGQSPA